MKKFIIASVLSIVAALAWVKKTNTSQTITARFHAIPISTDALSSAEFQKALNVVKSSREGSEQTFLIENFLSIDLSHGGKRSQQALLVLQMALRSRDELTQKEALQQAKSLLIDVAHGQTTVDPELRPGLKEVFRTFKTVGVPEIRLIAKANPQSPTLTYLQSLR